MLPLSLCVAWANTAQALEIPHERYRLENGLQVVLHEDHSLPTVVINIWYDVGSKEEVAGRSGFAHLFEHLMFMGTDRLPGSGFDDLMEAHGGWNNAWTSEDATDYYSVGPSHLAPTLLWMEADRLDGLDTAMTQEKLDLQREVVRNERRQSGEDTPYGVAWLELPSLMYPADHPYGHSVIGTHEDLEAATVEDVVSFFQRWYVPNNASLVVAGDFDSAAIKPLIEQWFGGSAGASLPERVPPEQLDKPVKPLLELEDEVQIGKTHLLWHTAPVLTPEDAAMDILAGILGSGRSSRLYRSLQIEQSLVQEVSAYQMSSQYGSMFMVEAIPTTGHSLEEVEAAIHRELVQLAEDGPSPDEIERVRNQLAVDFLAGLESLQARASALNRYSVLTGTPDWVEADFQRYQAVDVDSVRAAAKRLSADRSATLRVHPTPPDEGVTQ